MNEVVRMEHTTNKQIAPHLISQQVLAIVQGRAQLVQLLAQIAQRGVLVRPAESRQQPLDEGLAQRDAVLGRDQVHEGQPAQLGRLVRHQVADDCGQVGHAQLQPQVQRLQRLAQQRGQPGKRLGLAQLRVGLVHHQVVLPLEARLHARIARCGCGCCCARPAHDPLELQVRLPRRASCTLRLGQRHHAAKVLACPVRLRAGKRVARQARLLQEGLELRQLADAELEVRGLDTRLQSVERR